MVQDSIPPNIPQRSGAKRLARLVKDLSLEQIPGAGSLWRFIKREARGVKNGWVLFLVIAVAIVFATLFIQHKLSRQEPQLPQLYSGETMLRLFVKNPGQPPIVAVGQRNIFRWVPINLKETTFDAEGTKQKNTLILFIVFQQDVDASAFTFVVKTDVTPKPEWKFEDQGPRSCMVSIKDMPSGVFEVALEKPPINP